VSSYEPEPGYQYAAQSTGRRSVPDVSFDGDPNTGVAVYTTTPSNGAGGWEQVGGTSVGAPAWAAVIAVVNQGRRLYGIPNLDGPTQVLPTLYLLPSYDFHKVTSPTPSLRRSASSTVTAGLGTPNGIAAIYGLAFNLGVSSAAVKAAAPALATTTTTSGGSTGRPAVTVQTPARVEHPRFTPVRFAAGGTSSLTHLTALMPLPCTRPTSHLAFDSPATDHP
jgi:subtilase family serine protease